jgi:hypothetical protein
VPKFRRQNQVRDIIFGIARGTQEEITIEFFLGFYI